MRYEAPKVIELCNGKATHGDCAQGPSAGAGQPNCYAGDAAQDCCAGPSAANPIPAECSEGSLDSGSDPLCSPFGCQVVFCTTFGADPFISCSTGAGD